MRAWWEWSHQEGDGVVLVRMVLGTGRWWRFAALGSCREHHNCKSWFGLGRVLRMTWRMWQTVTDIVLLSSASPAMMKCSWHHSKSKANHNCQPKTYDRTKRDCENENAGINVDEFYFTLLACRLVSARLHRHHHQQQYQPVTSKVGSASSSQQELIVEVTAAAAHSICWLPTLKRSEEKKSTELTSGVVERGSQC